MFEHIALDPSDHPASTIYDLMAAAIVPRPIALVGTRSESGQPNLAPFSFFMPGGTNPPSLAFSPTLNLEGAPKDTLRNIEATREFTVNIVTREMSQGMNRTAFGFPSTFNEWEVAGFHAVDGEKVSSCRILESPIAFECKLFEIVRHGVGPGSACYVIGEIVQAFVAKSHWLDNRVRPGALRPIGRLGSSEYVDLALPEIFELIRPK